MKESKDMMDVSLSGGPLDGQTAEVEAGSLDLTKDGCLYSYQESTGFYCYVRGGITPKTKRRTKTE